VTTPNTIRSARHGFGNDRLFLSSVDKVADTSIEVPNLADGSEHNLHNFVQNICCAGLNDRSTGLLLSVSAPIAHAADMTALAGSAKTRINACRANRSSPSKTPVKTSTALVAYGPDILQKNRLCQLLSIGCFQFGEYHLSSGRVSPYLFDSSALLSGAALQVTGR
jgi:hypothetical protein